MDFLDNYFKYELNTEIVGLTLQLNVFYIQKLFQKYDKNIIVLTSSLYEANKLFDNLALVNANTLIFPMDDFLSSMIVAKSPELKYKRLETLDKIKTGKNIVVTNLMGFLKFLPSKNVDNSILINKDLEIKRDVLVDKFLELGYKRESMVTSSGEIAVRGFIVDIFPIEERHPIRIEFDGNTVESVKYFDENSQMSFENIDMLRVKAIDEMETDGKSSLYDYCDDSIVVYYDEAQINAAYNNLYEDIITYKQSKNIEDKLMFDLEEIKVSNKVSINTLGTSSFVVKELENYNEDFDLLTMHYNKWLENGKIVYFCVNTEDEKKKLKDLLPSANVIIKSMARGFIFDKYVVVCSNDIENTKKVGGNYKNNFHVGKRIKDFNQLQNGDYVVHLAHGIGIYKGITTLTVKGMKKDFLTISYASNDKIYVPVEKITSIYKYNDKDGKDVKINSLGSLNWQKTKKYISEKVKDISQELIRLYQSRLSIKKEPFKNYPEEWVFGSEFKYELTLDQQKSINDISNDLNSDVPMDRLLCGDVGFGKTEVAMRAMFKAVLNNKQVMYLCPTTILSKQQYNVALERFKNWPVEIALLNRYTSAKQVTEIINNLKTGKIDILFGTHKLLNDKVLCKNLGLLVVDEEQRFGVTHKEKIKSMKKDVNVLTLSATPIPRTLKMSLSGLRDLSIIDTPPVNRYPVQTYVVSEDDFIIKDAIYKELARNGQVFILYNKVESILNYVSYIKNLVPEASISYAHGQMDKNKLDKVMNDFIEDKFDILICTTIIESGIDIPNVNTLIIHDAEKFGLSQLYQIRGRVGRSDKIAYAYLMYDKNKMLNDLAIKRLNAIKEFTELGSGYKIAMRDLSLRGAGDIFGANQAGFVDSVGINLYMKMLEQEIKRQKGEEVLPENDDVKALLNVATHISNDYVSDEDIKIEIHQKINEIDSYEKLLQVKNELEDRFGKITDDMLIYMYEEWFEKIALKYNIKEVVETTRSIEITLPKEVSVNIKGDRLLMEAISLSHNFNIRYKNEKITIVLFLKGLPKHYIFYIVSLLEKIL